MNAPDLLLPPHAIGAEQSLIGGILLAGGEAFDRIEGVVSGDDLYRDDHRRIFAAAKAISEAGRPVDVVTVAEALERRNEINETGGLAYLAEMAQNTPSAANIRRYAEIVRQKAVLRGLLAIANGLQEACLYPDSREPEKIASEAESAMLRLLDHQGGDPVRLQDAIGEALNEMDDRQARAGKGAGLVTGFAGLDQIAGSLEPGQLVIVAARPSVGKTAFACNLVQHATAHTVPTLFFSLEMQRQEVAMRIMALLTGIPMPAMRAGTINDDRWREVSDTLRTSERMPLFIDDRGAITVAYVRAKARRIKRQHGLGLIVIDYLQLMHGQGDTRTQEIGSISRGLKALAKELQVPIVALAQVNRAVETRVDKRPLMADLRESGDIEADADLILMLHREASDEWAGLIEMIVRKNRNGPLGEVIFNFDGPTMQFSDHNGPNPRQQQPKQRRGGYTRGFDD